MAIFPGLILPADERGISLFICVIFYFLLSVSYSFQCTGLTPPWFNLSLSVVVVFPFWCNFEWDCFLPTTCWTHVETSLLALFYRLPHPPDASLHCLQSRLFFRTLTLSTQFFLLVFLLYCFLSPEDGGEEWLNQFNSMSIALEPHKLLGSSETMKFCRPGHVPTVPLFSHVT